VEEQKMRKGWKIAAAILGVYTLVVTILVHFDKDVYLLRQEFSVEVESVNFHELPVQAGYEIYDALDIAYGGHLDKIVLKRNALFKKKGIWMMGGWRASVNIGELIAKTSAIYFTFTPWRLRLRD